MTRTARLLSSLLALLALAWPTATPAQDGEELSWYAVEMIVFERTSEAGRDAESWPAEPGLPDVAGAVELSVEGLAPPTPADPLSPPAATGEAPTGSDAAMPASMPRAFQLLPASDFRLTEAWKRLDRSGAYRPLLHIAWVQPGYSSEEARLVHVRNDNAGLGAVSSVPDTTVAQSLPAAAKTGTAVMLSSPIRVARDRSKAAIDGTVKVHRARYLHVQADLLYYRPLATDTYAVSAANDAGGAALPDSPDTALIEQLLAEGDATPRLFRLSESRRMRSRELHYLDHPLFGVLVEIWPVELPEAALPRAEPAPLSPAPTPPAEASGG